MTLENKLFRQQQREAGNPYKEETRSWIAWSRGYVDGQLAMAMKRWKAMKKRPKKARVAVPDGKLCPHGWDTRLECGRCLEQRQPQHSQAKD